jgi:hypothetical protein
MNKKPINKLPPTLMLNVAYGKLPLPPRFTAGLTRALLSHASPRSGSKFFGLGSATGFTILPESDTVVG